ncbi:MAG: hypothetical protein WBG63_01900 [Phormidesmis sp.]
MSNPSLQTSASHRPNKVPLKPLLAVGLICSLTILLMDIKGIKTFLSTPLAFAHTPMTRPVIDQLSGDCTTDIVSSAQLSREQLLKLLTVPERDSKSRVRQITTEPYCQLSSINIRAGVAAEREAYPLAFDPTTALVILYENDEYAGYRFLF